MHSALAIIILGWGAVYGYVALYSLTLWTQRRERRQYATFGLVALGLVVECVGASLIVDAPDLRTGDLGLRIKLAGAAFTLAFLHHFALQLAGRDRPRLRVFGYVWTAVVVLMTASGLATDAGTPTPPPTWGLSGAPDYREPVMTSLGIVTNALAWPLVASTLHALYLAARDDRRARPLFFAVTANMLAVTQDYFIQLGSLGSYYLAEHAGMLTMWAMAVLLLERFMDTSTELDLRTRELAESYDELRHTEKALVKKEQLAAVGELSGLIAEQVRGPLAQIKRCSAELGEGEPAEGTRALLFSVLDSEIDRLARLVDDLLSFARPIKPRPRATDIREVIEQAVATRVPDDGAYRQEVDLEELPERLHCDADLLRDALENIIDNAVQAMPDGGGISVWAVPTTRRGRPWVIIQVRDSGGGMDVPTQGRAQEPFFTTRAHGTGLGLAIVDRVARVHGGHMTIHSQRDLGTTVSLTLPVEDESSLPSSSDSGESSGERERGRR